MVRIGLVDDDSEHLKLMREFLGRYEREEKVGFSIEEYRDGLSFVEDYDGTLDVVFLDIEMPHIDGMTAAKKSGRETRHWESCLSPTWHSLPFTAMRSMPLILSSSRSATMCLRIN